MADTLVSIIAPLWNVENYLRRTIDSVLEQIHSNYELILVDDGSTDLTRQIINEYAKDDPRIVPVFLPSNQGGSSARNEGLRISRGDFISFIDGDDLWHPSFLEKTLAQMTREKPECAAVFCWSLGIDETGCPNGRDNRPKSGQYPLSRLISQTSVVGNGSCLLIRRTFFDRAGQFETSLRVGADTELWLRMLSLAPEVNYFFCLPGELVSRRTRPNQLTSNFLTNDRFQSWDLRLKRYIGLLPENLRSEVLLTYIIAGARNPLTGSPWLKSWLTLARREFRFRPSPRSLRIFIQLTLPRDFLITLFHLESRLRVKLRNFRRRVFV